MSQKDIQSSIQQKIKNLTLPQKPFQELFSQYFTDQVKEKIRSLILNPNELYLQYDQQKHDNNQSNMPTAKGDKPIQEEFENEEKQSNNIKAIYNLPLPQQITGLICFIKGLFYETGFITSKEEYIKALESYKEGLKVEVDSLCAYRLAEIYSSSKVATKFGVKVNQELSYAYLIISNAYLDVQYNNNLININHDVEQVSSNFEDQQKYAIEIIKRNQQIIFPSFSELRIATELQQLESILTFKHSDSAFSQKYYESMIKNLGEKDDARSLLLIIKTLSNQTHNQNKQVKSIVEISQKYSLQSINQALQWILSDLSILSILEKDHEVFNCLRTSFVEMFYILKIISLDTQLLVSYSQNDHNTIHAKINQITEMLYKQRHIFKNQLHNVLIIRIRTELIRKGIGQQQSYEKALQTIEEEKEIKKGQQSLYAYYYYKKAKLLDKLNRPNVDIQNNFNISQDLFLERLSSPDITTQVLARYYLARIYQQNNEQQSKAHEQLKTAVELYKQNQDKFNQVKTFQFELLQRKTTKKFESFDLSKLIESRMSRQSTQKMLNFDDGITLQLKVELVSKENGFVFFDESLFEILEFVAKGEIGSTSLAKINYDLLDEKEHKIIQKSDTLAQPHTHYMTIGSPRQQKQKEKVIIKQIPFNKNNYFDRIFYHLAKIQKVNCNEGLLRQKGFCVNQVNDMAFELWMVYPKLEYNLYALIKQNVLNTESKKISFSLSLAETLKNLHDNGSYHGNVKPSNVLMDNQQKSFFNDWEFGCKMHHKKEKVIQKQKSKFKTDDYNNESPNIDDDDSLDKNPLYSDGYIAPELFQNRKASQLVGALSDVWGLGMIYYYIFTGRDPSFCGLIQEQQLYNKNNLKIPRETIPNQVIRELIESMVKDDPQQRTHMTKVRDILINQCLYIKTQTKELQLDLNHPNDN